MLRFKDFIEEGRAFAAPKVIQTVAAQESQLGEQFSSTGVLLVFDAPKQRTWIVASNLALYCVIDKLIEKAPRTRWKIPKEQIIGDDGITLSITSDLKSERTGTLYIGDKRPRLFSRHLFTDVPIERRIKHLIMKEFDVPT